MKIFMRRSMKKLGGLKKLLVFVPCDELCKNPLSPKAVAIAGDKYDFVFTFISGGLKSQKHYQDLEVWPLIANFYEGFEAFVPSGVVYVGGCT